MRRSKKIIKLDREQLGNIIRWATGHNFLRNHKFNINPSDYPNPGCRLCGQAPESAEHVIFHCTAIKEERDNLLPTKQGETMDPTTLSIEHLNDFLDKIAYVLEDSQDNISQTSNTTSTQNPSPPPN